jgi:sialic acid synthase SpsE
MTYFIAEICSNHLNDFNRCKKLIDNAKEIGCDAVKFQLFKANQLFSKEILKNSKPHRNIKKLELSVKLIPKLSSYAKKKKIDFGCTPFDIDSLRFLKKYVDFYKIGSYELLRKDLFLECIKFKKKIIFSTGMANKKEINDILNIFKKKNFYNFSVLRCVSSYPTNFNMINLQSIESLKLFLKKKFKNKKIKVGWSDHSKNEGVVLKSIYKYNADIIEFHLDLDGKGPEYTGGHCWLPHEFKKVIELEKQNKFFDGNGVLSYQAVEKNERNWRSDPKDGLRPIRKERKKFIK